MPIIKGTDKIKSVLILDLGNGNIKLQVVKGQIYHINNDNFLDYHVQTAIRMGFLTYEESSVHESSGIKIRLRNSHNKPLTISGYIESLKPGQPIVLDEDEIRSSSIQSAISKGLLSIEGPLADESLTESSVSIGDTFIDDESFETAATDDVDHNHLETNDEILTGPNVIDTEFPEPISSKQMQDPRKKAVIWNPANNPIMKEMQGTTVVKGKGKVIHDQPILDADNGKTVDNDVQFVDVEHQKNRIKSHPKLKDKLEINQNQEIDFIDKNNV